MEFLCYGPEQVGFQTRVILDLWGMVFHAMVAFGLGLDLLFKSIWACCESTKSFSSRSLNSKSTKLLGFIELRNSVAEISRDFSFMKK